MKLTRIMTLTIALLMFGASMMDVSATETILPVLISVQQQEVRGTFLNYEQGVLTVTTEGEVTAIAVDHDGAVEPVKEVSESTYGAQFSKLQPGTLLDMSVSVREDGTFILESLIAIHQLFSGSSETAEPELIKVKVMNEQFSDGFEMTFEDESIVTDVAPQVIDGKVMVPLRAVAEALGFQVQWNPETRGVDLIRGPQFTTIYIGENSYFKNRMAASPLSAAPVIVQDRTMVPVEFITEILQHGIEFQDGVMKIYDEAFTTLTGYVSLIEKLADYTKVYVAPRQGDDVEMWEQTVLIVSEDTVINREPYGEGDLIHGVHLPVMTMSIPGQTGAVIIY